MCQVTWQQIEHRSVYYERVIRAVLSSLAVDTTKLRFVRGTTHQLTREYTLDIFKLAAITTVHDAEKAGSDVVKQSKHPVLSGLMYPTLQALDEEYLDAYVQFGGVDQRKIFVMATK